MRIAFFHNRYQQPGGEDVMVDFECRLLEDAGHDVMRFEVSNDSVFQGGRMAVLRGCVLTAARAHWNCQSQDAVAKAIARFKPDVGHVHNWFPLLSPSIYQAHRQQGVPVVQTLHNYRLGCANGCFWRDGRICTDCLEGDRGHAVAHRCYRGSSLQTMVWRRVMDRGWDASNKGESIFSGLVDAYLAPSEIVKKMHMEMGLPHDKVFTLPNACVDPQKKTCDTMKDFSKGAVFVGRLEPEKGIDVLIEAWQKMKHPLTVVGEGSMREKLMKQCADQPWIQFVGQQPHDRVIAFMKQAAVVVFPSRWLEPFGLGVIEAMACGRPVIVGNIGGPAEIVEHEVSGLCVEAGNAQALYQAVSSLLQDSTKLKQMGHMARTRYLAEYHPQKHLEGLMSVYQYVVDSIPKRNAA